MYMYIELTPLYKGSLSVQLDALSILKVMGIPDNCVVYTMNKLCFQIKSNLLSWLTSENYMEICYMYDGVDRFWGRVGNY